MGNVHLVTGYAGQEHVTATDHAAFNASLIGRDDFVLDNGNVFAVQVISNNQIRVLDGELMMQGRFVRLNPDTYVDLTIENGAQGMKRNDLIAVRYTKDTASGIESADLVVIKGTAVASTSVPADPEYTEADITNGAAVQNDFPLWRIPLDGLNVGTPVMLFEPFSDSLRTLPGLRNLVLRVESEFDAKYTNEEVLSDDTREKLGLNALAIPDAAFAKLANVFRHTWSGLATSASYTILEPVVHQTGFGSLGTSAVVYYSDQINFDAATGKLSLVNPATLGFTRNEFQPVETLRGKYFMDYANTGLETGAIYYMDPDAAEVEAGGHSAYGWWVKFECSKLSVSKAGEVSFLYSYDRNAYEDDFILNGTHYYYRGTVVDNAFLGSKIDFGSYVGTGTYGADYPNTLTFAFEPKMVFIFDDTGDSGFAWLHGSALGLRYHSGGCCNLAWDGNVLSWWVNGAAMQYNTADTTYHFVAIG